MSQENLDVVRGLYSGWSEGDFRQGMEWFDDDVQLTIAGSVGLVSGPWKGVDQLGTAWGDYLAAWEGYRTGPIEHLLESGDHVVAFNRLRGTGKRSGIEAESSLRAAVFTFRGGKIVGLLLTDVPGALAAVGLAE